MKNIETGRWMTFYSVWLKSTSFVVAAVAEFLEVVDGVKSLALCYRQFLAAVVAAAVVVVAAAVVQHADWVLLLKSATHSKAVEQCQDFATEKMSSAFSCWDGPMLYITL